MKFSIFARTAAVVACVFQHATSFRPTQRGFPVRSFSVIKKYMADVEEASSEEKVVKFGYQVFIGNLPFSVDEQRLNGMVSERVQSFTKLRLAMDKASGRSRGFAFLDFDTKETAESAVAALSGLEVDDRQLKIDLSEPKERSYKSGGDSPSGDRPPRAPRPPSENSVFLGNLDFSTTEDAIKDMFESALGEGSVQKVRIATDRDTGRAKGFAHVDFGSAEVAARAVAELNGVDLMGRPVRVDHAQRKEEGGAVRPPRERSPMAGREHSIFLGNLAWDITPELVEDMINDVLGPGLYTQVRLAIDRETGRQRGFGHIDFKDADSAERAVKELDGLEVMGRQLRADHAQRNAAPGGFSGGGGGGRGGGGRGRGRGGGGGDRYGGGGGQDSGSFGSW